MNFINDLENVHKDPVQLKLYRAWKHIQSKVSANNKKHQEGATVCSSWYLLSNFMEDITTVDNYKLFLTNPVKFKLMLYDGMTHYNKDNVYFKELFAKAPNGAYCITQEEYNHIYKHFNIIYSKYSAYIPYTDYKELINYAIGRATITYDKSKNVLFTTFANRVVQNHILDFIRDNKKYTNCYYLSHVMCVDDKAILLADVLDNQNDLLMLNKTVYKIREAKKALTQQENNILSGLILGYTQKEISAMLSIPPARVSRTVARIRKVIKSYL